MAKGTWKQTERQATRENDGQYAKMNPCGLCGKGTGAEYCSDHRVDTPAFENSCWGLCLCDPCGVIVGGMDDDKALALLKAAAQLPAGMTAHRRLKALGVTAV